jgi:hypothetical protein
VGRSRSTVVEQATIGDEESVVVGRRTGFFVWVFCIFLFLFLL